MARVKVENGTKLELVAQTSKGDQTFGSSLTKQTNAGKKWLIARPILDGEIINLPAGTSITMSWGTGAKWNTLYGTVEGPVKQGVRVYLSVATDGEVITAERRTNARIPAELNAELIQYETGLNRERRALTYPSKTSDISTGGLAMLTNATLAVGEVVECTLMPESKSALSLKGEICWVLDAPKNTGFHSRAGLQFIFSNAGDASKVAQLTASLAARQ